jgi:hypothetical protein
MNLSSEHRLLAFLAAVAALGGGVRLARAGRAAASEVGAPQPALEHQIAAADSAAHAGRAHAARPPESHASQDTLHRRRTSRRDTSAARRDSAAHAAPNTGTGILDRRGYVGRRLDLDVATAAQIDSLPGVTPTMAKRIAADRMAHGPFLNMDGLRRVEGAGPGFEKAIDSLVTFTGTIVPPNPNDTVIAHRRNARL